MSERVILGNDVETGRPLYLGDIERRSGLYVLGKPGMGKSALLVNIMNQDIEHGHSLFFLDPHIDAITDLLNRGDSGVLSSFGRVLDPEDERFSFGINLLSCRDITSLKERTETYTKAYNVFYKLWEDEWGPWLQLILQNTLWAFIENQEYTLAEVPMFLNPRNTAFRNHIVGNIKYNSAVVDFWGDFFKRRERDQQEMADAALTRVTTLLTHPYVRDIIGQRKTTINFATILKPPIQDILLVKLSANLAADIKRFIGTILISELLHAVRNRPESEREQFCIFVDEFQNFTNSEDFTTLITEGRKFGVATTIVHVERFGQFANMPKLQGATLATVNKVFFQVIVPDAKEVAPEYAKEATTTETRLEPELVIVQEPFWDLLRRGHANPQIQDFVNKFLWPIKYYLDDRQAKLEEERINKASLQDKATLYRDEVSMSQADERLMRQGYNPPINQSIESTKNAIDRMRNAHIEIQGQNVNLYYLHLRVQTNQKMIDSMNEFLRELMRGSVNIEIGDDSFTKFILTILEFAKVFMRNEAKYLCYQEPLLKFFVSVMYGNPDSPKSITAWLAHLCFPEELKAAYIQDRKTKNEKAYREEEKEITQVYGYGVKSVDMRMQEDLESYHQAQVFLHPTFRCASIKTKGRYDERERKQVGIYTIQLPDLPARVYCKEDRDSLILLSAQILEDNMKEGLCTTELFVIMQDIHQFCELLQKPENYIKIPSGQYVAKPVNVRLVSDMTNEMAQELANLPRFTAWAKVIDERDGQQVVIKRKIKTLPLPPLQETPKGKPDIESRAIANGHSLCKERVHIEDEIGERQKRWRRNTASRRPPPAEEPPPAHS